jgi:hypothetical protein
MNVKGDSDEAIDGNEERVLETGGKSYRCKILGQQFSSDL